MKVKKATHSVAWPSKSLCLCGKHLARYQAAAQSMRIEIEVQSFEGSPDPILSDIECDICRDEAEHKS